MTNEEIDKEELHAELGRIKDAMGIHERYPYMTQLWLVEGVVVGIGAIATQIGMRQEIPLYWYGILWIGLVIVEQVVFRRIMVHSGRPVTGPKPSVNILVAAMVLGIFALITGLDPLIAHERVNEAVVGFTIATALFGVLYLSVGTLLSAYSIRKSDRYAIYIGGLWLLALAAAIPSVPILREWAFVAFGVSVLVHGVGSYLALSRI